MQCYFHSYWTIELYALLYHNLIVYIVLSWRRVLFQLNYLYRHYETKFIMLLEVVSLSKPSANRGVALTFISTRGWCQYPELRRCLQTTTKVSYDRACYGFSYYFPTESTFSRPALTSQLFSGLTSLLTNQIFKISEPKITWQLGRYVFRCMKT